MRKGRGCLPTRLEVSVTDIRLLHAQAWILILFWSAQLNISGDIELTMRR